MRALEPTHAIDPARFIDPCCQRFDPQVKGDHLTGCLLLLLDAIRKRSILVPSPISTDCHLAKPLWWPLVEMSLKSGEDLWAVFASTSCW